MSSRQMALLIGAGGVALLVAFVLGVAVGLLEPGRGREPAPAEGVTVAATEPTPGFFAPPTEEGEPVSPGSSPERAGELPPPPALPPATVPPLPEPSPTLPPPPSPAVSLPPRRSPEAWPTPSPAPQAPPREEAAVPAGVWLQLGSLSQAQQGEGLKQRVIAMGFAPSQVVVFRASDGRFRVRLGPFPDQESADRVLTRLRTQGFPDAFAVRE